MSFRISEQFQISVASILDFMYPPLCVCCGTLLARGSDHVCVDCWSSLTQVHRDHPLYQETRSKLLASGTVSDLVALFVFEKEGAFQSIAHALKYSGVQALGIELGRRLAEAVTEQDISSDVIVPVPLHKRKTRERGYNQSELIARGLSAGTGVPVRSNVLRRTRYTETQTALSLQERKENMDNAFACTSEAIADSSIILIDDVITTGATIEACASALMASGARRIIAASAALAQ